MSNSHFEGKSVVEHLKAARKKGALASAEIHGTEIPGHISGGADSAKETCLILLLAWVLFPLSLKTILLLAGGFFLWKVGRSALIGWARLERLHRLIEEERWEIEHHREQEREELTALYRAKGLTGKLLDETITVLMADDNRLLRIMLEEEMGLTLEVYEHPLKQSVGAGVGVLFATTFFLGGTLLASWGPLLTSAMAIAVAAFVAAKSEKNQLLEALVWTLSVAAFSVGAIYFLR
ncbi:MAG TPA: VIT1/CCC1 transporter family protein [Rhabdochlamydiaceae bacterium]|nr:VIT1/CCC1 transporter family protein [Rhabdochlamydiaceae bacterium]